VARGERGLAVQITVRGRDSESGKSLLPIAPLPGRTPCPIPGYTRGILNE